MPKFAVIRQDHTFVDLQGVTIHWYSWTPGKPKGIVLIVHGVGEHALRYEHVAQHLVNAGYLVAALDQRGHGATGLEQAGGDASRLGRLGAGGGAAVIGDVVTLVKRLRGEHPQLPFGVIGHSWGSLTMQRFLNRHAALVDAVVLSGTAYRMPGSMAAGDLNARHKHLGDTGYEWLSRDVAVQEAFAADPLTFPADILKLFGVVEALRLFGVPARSLGVDIPVLVAVGSDDTLGAEPSARRLVRAYEQRTGLTDVTLRVYPGARHEIFNEITKSQVLDDVTAWLDAHLVPDAAGGPRRPAPAVTGSAPAPEDATPDS